MPTSPAPPTPAVREAVAGATLAGWVKTVTCVSCHALTLTQHCWVQRMSAHTHSHLSIVPFCNAVASNPCGYYNLTCHNNGSCISMYTGNGTYTYSCLCLPSFTGADCSRKLPSESMIDRNRTDDYFDECFEVSLRTVNDFSFTSGTQCGSVECLNGGQCLNSTCVCSPPYSGNDCSTFNVCEFK